MKGKGDSGGGNDKDGISEVYRGMAGSGNDSSFAGAGTRELGSGRSGVCRGVTGQLGPVDEKLYIASKGI